MNQNPITFDLSDAELAAVQSALSTLERHFAGRPGLRPRERQSLPKMGPKSEAFCRRAVLAFSQNPQVMARNFDVAQFERQLSQLDILRTLVVRTTRLFEQMRDTEIQIGSSVMRASLEGYAMLKVAGRGQGLEGIRAAMGERFQRRGAAAPADPIAHDEGDTDSGTSTQGD